MLAPHNIIHKIAIGNPNVELARKIIVKLRASQFTIHRVLQCKDWKQYVNVSFFKLSRLKFSLEVVNDEFD